MEIIKITIGKRVREFADIEASIDYLSNITSEVAAEDIKLGEHFIYGDIEWVKLDDCDRNVLALTAEVLFNKAFDEDNGNCWETSSLRKYLNEWNDDGTLKAIEGIKRDDLMPFSRDLTTDDGLNDYGMCWDYISLLTCNEYRKYRKSIPNCGKWHWTITADSLEYKYLVRIVGYDGSLAYNYAYLGYSGVRPLCVLKSGTLVERRSEQENKNKPSDGGFKSVAEKYSSEEEENE